MGEQTKDDKIRDKLRDWEAVNEVVQKGNTAEVRLDKDGSWKILEAVKHIVKAS